MKRKTITKCGGVLLAALAHSALPNGVQGQVFISDQIFVGANDTMAISSDVGAKSDVQGTGTLLLNGTSSQTLDWDGHSVPGLILNNAAGVSLASDAKIRGLLHLEAGHLLLNDGDFTFAAAANHSGARPDAFLVTNGTGQVVAEGLAAQQEFLFPIGSTLDVNDYTPATITNQTTPRDIRVQVKNHANSAAVVHKPAYGIDRVWEISSNHDGDATIALKHNEATEGGSFVRQNAFVTRQLKADGTEWSVSSPVTGVDDKTHEGTFSLSGSQSDNRFYSKSSNQESSLGETTVSLVRDETGFFACKGYPNPFTSAFTVQITVQNWEGAVPYSIMDVTGRIVETGTFQLQSGDNRFLIQLGNMPTGNYILKCDTDYNGGITIPMTKI